MREWLSGRASPCQGERREFESRLPLHKSCLFTAGFFYLQQQLLAYCLLNLAGGYFSVNGRENTSPAFIWHDCGNKVISIEHSLEYATELHEKGINAEFHIFPDGKHGMVFTQKTTNVECHISQWADLLIKWFDYIEWFNNCDIMNVTENQKDVLTNKCKGKYTYSASITLINKGQNVSVDVKPTVYNEFIYTFHATTKCKVFYFTRMGV